MAHVVATVNSSGNALRYAGGSGVNAADVVIQTGDVTRYYEFTLFSTGGVMTVFACLDDTNYATAPLSMYDGGSASSTTLVLVTVANRIYRIQGFYKFLQVQQSGSVAVTGATMLCSRWGGQP